jgi:hypothetical protein
MIQGMGQVVQYIPSVATLTQLSKELLEVYRCLEILRAILYGTDSPLEVQSILEKTGSSQRLALSLSQDLMIEASRLSHQ